MKRLLATGLSPNLEKDDAVIAAGCLIAPWRYRHGDACQKLTAELENFFKPSATTADAPAIWLFNSGRSALLVCLQALNLAPNDEVLLQAFTCNAVPNPVLWAGLKPVYVDITADQSYTMDPADLERKITPRSRVLIIQHTFGRAADLDRLLVIAKKHHLIVIEDCAHTIGGQWHGQLLGTFGDAAIISFGRDKVISSVYGGALVVSNKKLLAKVAKSYAALPYPTLSWIAQQLLHPVVTYLAISAWYWSRIGQIIFWFAKRTHLLSLAVAKAERSGHKPNYFPTRLPNALAALALHQWHKLASFNNHRQQIAAIYQQQFRPTEVLDDSVYLRYPIEVDDPKQLIKRCSQNGIILGDWYDSVIAPATTNLSKLDYHLGSCPTAENAALHIVNLPTHIHVNQSSANNIIKYVLSDYAQ